MDSCVVDWIDVAGTSEAEVGCVCVGGGVKDLEGSGKDKATASLVVDSVGVVDGMEVVDAVAPLRIY